MKTSAHVVTAFESSLVQQLRLCEDLSRVELARAMDVAPSTIGLYVDRLIKDGFLREGRRAPRQAGRPPITLELNAQAGQFVGVDFEARQLTAVAVDFSQQILKHRQESLRADDDADSVVAKINKAIRAVAGRQRPLLGVGVAVPGTVDDRRGVAVHYEYIRNWRQVPLVERLTEQFEAPIYLENNIRAMALAERWFGNAAAVEDFVCVGVRSGIGAGVVLNGQLYRGTSNLAGEIGGWQRATGASTLEEQASVRAILQRVASRIAGGGTSLCKLRPGGKVLLAEVLQAARDGDLLVMDVLHGAVQAIGEAISQLDLLLNPEQVVLAGPLAELGELFLEPLRNVVARRTPQQHAPPPRLVASQLGEFGGALGAAAIAVHQWRPAPKGSKTHART